MASIQFAERKYEKYFIKIELETGINPFNGTALNRG